MFRFANPYLLNLLFLIPLLIAIYIVFHFFKKRAMRRFTDMSFYDILMPMRSPGRNNIKFILYLMAIISIIIALARPQFGSKLEEVKREGIELIIALDVSRSMLAEDIKPNRLERAKQAITSMIDKMQDDKIGMIVFAGDAYTQLPITTDYISAKIFLSNISTGIVSKQGTAIGSAIELGMKSFTQDQEASKVIVIISDGENHEGDATEAAKRAAEKGILVYTIGMGSSKGALIPVTGGRTSQAGYLQDRQGNPVISRLNAKMLKDIAHNGGGEFYAASTGNVGLNKLYNELNQLNKSEIETKVYSEYDDQFHYFIAFALLLLLIDFLIMERKNQKFANLSIFRKNLPS
ncbi:MAG: VWA domain-containing protein [Bacteroidales bacterium]|nr:VWA domain-containing protein [Bacteroidales bacterium]